MENAQYTAEAIALASGPSIFQYVDVEHLFAVRLLNLSIQGLSERN